jgi:hypothetical protein
MGAPQTRATSCRPLGAPLGAADAERERARRGVRVSGGHRAQAVLLLRGEARPRQDHLKGVENVMRIGAHEETPNIRTLVSRALKPKNRGATPGLRSRISMLAAFRTNR